MGKKDTVEIADVAAEDYVVKQYRTYGIETLEMRAVPCLQDGLKPVQRRVLYAAYKAGAVPGHNFLKSAAVVGRTMSDFHPHGDKSVYDAIVNLVNPNPLVIHSSGGHPYSPFQPQGNFGAPPRDQFPAAAMRYTEVRLSRLGMLNFECIDVAEMVTNYSGTTTEPKILPTRLPLLLLLGTEGIAVGASTAIPRHGLKAVLSVVKHLLKHPDATVKQLVAKLGHPDVGHSIVISPKEDVAEMYREGKGTIRWCCSHHIERGKNQHELIVTSFAPGFNIARLLSVCEELEAESKIISVNNETDKRGPRIVILFRDPGVIEERVLPALQSFQHYQWNVLDLQTPTVDSNDVNSGTFRGVDLKTYLNLWIEYRRTIERNMLLLERSRAKEKLAREQARMAACQNAARIGQIMGNRRLTYDQKKSEIQGSVHFRWKNDGTTVRLTDEQVEYLLEQKIRSLDSLNEESQRKSIAEILKQLKRIRIELSDIDGVISEHLIRIEKDFQRDMNEWTPTEWSNGAPELKLPESSTDSNGYWCIDERGFVRDYPELPERRGKWHAASFTVPKTETVTIVESNGTAYTLRSVFLSHGRSDYREVVGVISSDAPYLLVVDDHGDCAVVEHPMKAAEGNPMRIRDGHKLIAAYGFWKSDMIYAFGVSGGKFEVKNGKDLIKLARRPNSLGWKLITRSNKPPRIIIVPKGGAIVSGEVGIIDPNNVQSSNAIFGVGPKTYVITVNNDKRVCDVKGAAALAAEQGLQSAFLLR